MRFNPNFNHFALVASIVVPLLLLNSSQGDEPDNGTQLCIVQDPQILEASGIAVSRTTQNALWMHNDSGDTPRLFLVDLNGRTRAIVNVAGVTATDWEDMCSFEIDGESWLLIGDFGDNGTDRGIRTPACQLLLIREPKLPASDREKEVPETSVEVIRTITFEFPDGPRNCESVAVDTFSRTILMVTKADPLHSALYSLPLTLTSGKEHMKAQKLASLGVTYATAMDVSPDGRQLVVVDMFSGAMLTRADPTSESWIDASRRPATVLNLPRRHQGETVCFTADGKSLLLNSEGVSQPLWRVENPVFRSPDRESHDRTIDKKRN